MRRPRADRGENHGAGRNTRLVGRRACDSTRDQRTASKDAYLAALKHAGIASDDGDAGAIVGLLRRLVRRLEKRAG